MKQSLTIAGEALGIRGNDLYINCGDDQPVTVAQLTFADREAAMRLYCNPLKVRLVVETCDAGEAARLYRLNAAAADLLEAAKKAEKFIAAMMGFYGQNLEVANWHLNGDTEPLDRFIEDNSTGDELESLRKAIAKAEAQS